MLMLGGRVLIFALSKDHLKLTGSLGGQERDQDLCANMWGEDVIVRMDGR